MPAWLYSALRALAQSLGGYAFTYLASHGVDVPVEAQTWVVQFVLVAGGVAGYVAVARWMEDRTGSSFKDRAFRLIAQVLNGGAAKPPVYPTK